MAPDLVAHVKLFPTDVGGKSRPALPGYGCPCMTSKVPPFQGFDTRLQLGGTPLHPGDQRKVGFVFLTPEGAAAMREAGTFYLWEGRFIGEATVVPNGS